jgi:hypothetical protein
VATGRKNKVWKIRFGKLNIACDAGIGNDENYTPTAKLHAFSNH